MAKSLDAWMQHLEQHGLLTLHIEAQRVGYRVRIATSDIFDMEYEGGLAVLAARANALKRFENSTQGIEEARSFLAFAAREIEKARSLLVTEGQGQPGPGMKECHACGQPFKAEDGYFEEGQYSYCAKCCNW